eukprot:TRINITY_DN6091_c1_g1_i1.p1 TRINITY_DN6091_c1_g1~~TRINITY_DN6091_c1_g1_i1.p1  ORF type:complete len:170 (-),score=19.04 TRINITY_DN6091_c1_g1_i1:152-661(-)
MSLPVWRKIQATPLSQADANTQALLNMQLYKFHSEGIREIRPFIVKWEGCRDIDVSKNKISSLPDSLSELTDLHSFNVSDNRISAFPTVILSMPWVISLNISGNLEKRWMLPPKLFTELPRDITRMTNLVNLDIADGAGVAFVQRAPHGITSLPCYATSKILQNLCLYE